MFKRFMKHPLAITLIGATVIGLVGYVRSDYFAFQEKILQGFQELQNAVDSQIFLDESAYKFCSVYRVTSCSICSCFHEQDEYKILSDMSSKFLTTTIHIRKMGKFLPYSTFLSLYKFSCWQNSLMSYPSSICGAKMLKTPRQMDMWRNEIMIEVEKDREKYQHFGYAIKQYYYYITSNKIYEQYPRTGCPKFQNEYSKNAKRAGS